MLLGVILPFFISITLFSQPVAQAQEESSAAPSGIELTRATALRRVLKTNPQISAEQAAEFRARSLIEQVDAARYPQLSLIAGVLTGQAADNTDSSENGIRSRRRALGDFNIDQVRPTFLGQVGIIQQLGTFGKIGHRDRAAKANLRAAKAQTQLKANAVAVEFADIYEAHLYAKEILLFVADIRGVIDRNIEETQARIDVAAGDVNMNDLLRLKTGLSATKVIENQAKAVVSQTTEGFRAYLSLPPDISISTKEKYLDPVNKDTTALENLIQHAKQNRPEILALEDAIVAFGALSDAEHAGYYPNFFLAGFASGAYTVDRDFVQSRYVFDRFGHLFGGFMIGAQWQIQWDMATHRASELKAEQHRYSQLLLWAKNGIPAEVNRYYQEVVRARSDLDELGKSISTTKRWVIRASADFSAGFGDSRSVVEAVQAYVLMKNSQLDAVYRLNTNLARLAQATGTFAEEAQLSLYPGNSGK